MSRPVSVHGSRLAGLAAVCVLLLIGTGVAGQLWAHDLVTSDGLTVQVDDAGVVTGVQMGGEELLTTGTTGGFLLTDYSGVSGTNLLANNGFEGGFTHWGDNIHVPDNWSLVLATGTADNIQLQADTGGPYEGANALRFVTTQTGKEEEPLERDVIEVASDTFAVDPNVVYYCRSVARSDFGWSRDVNVWPYDAIFYLDWYDDTATLISSSKALSVQQTFFHWARFTGWARAPENAASAAVRIHVSGNVKDYDAGISTEILLDDVSCFREPDGIRDIPVTGTVTDTAGVLDLTAENVGSRGLDVTARLEPLADRIEISGQVTFSDGIPAGDRALNLTFALPVDTSSMAWFWYDGPSRRHRIRNQTVYDDVVDADAISSTLKFNAYNLSCISDGARALNYAREPELVRPFYVEYLAADDRYLIHFQIGLAPERPTAGFDFIIYTSEPEWNFSGAVQDYYDIYTGYGQLRQLGGEPLVGGMNGGRAQSIIGGPYETDPQDFGVRYYIAHDATDAQHLTDTLGLNMLYYMMPWMVKYESDGASAPPPYSAFRDAVDDQPSPLWENYMIDSFASDHVISVNDTTSLDYLLYRITYYSGQQAYQYFGPVYINTEDTAPSFGNRYIEYLDQVYQHFIDNLGSDHYLTGVMMDLTNSCGAVLDGTRDRFATAGYDLTYSPSTFEPALWNLNAFQNFMVRLDQHLEANHPDRDIISANMLEDGYLFSAANYLDCFGWECSPITSNNWNAVELDYRRIISGSKPISPVIAYNTPLVFDEPNDEYYKGMCDILNVCLLYDLYLDPHKFAHTNDKDLEELREVMAGVLPYIDDFSKMGWNPNHRVRLVNESDEMIYDPYMYLSRYGPSDAFDGGETACVVLYYNHNNFKVFDTIFPRPGSLPEVTDFRMKIDLDEIGMSEPVTLEEMTATMHDMEPTVPPDLNLTNNGDGTVTITGSIVWRDALVLKFTEYTPDTTPPAVPTNVQATVLLP